MPRYAHTMSLFQPSKILIVYGGRNDEITTTDNCVLHDGI